MNSVIETLFTSDLGLYASREVTQVVLDSVKQRIDFDVMCQARPRDCAVCGASAQCGTRPRHDGQL
ncbi:hypothetical protein [Actimicrobium sp. CCI2.3]|uniref:hypothetical protein n=1 Tax=Actimicrobium sp. CCI2.3 TaxID=3048616 RepID=UPI002B249BD9|nr:hypothetical protein [Actimicrobium sp. CCI2.3]MEB0021492.1 hypothetical protein [Actimicrobium sp. CCI2.3]